MYIQSRATERAVFDTWNFAQSGSSRLLVVSTAMKQPLASPSHPLYH